jgi:hypothetical protein
VYSPEPEIVPPVADHVTAVLLLPVTVTENCCDPPICKAALTGEIATETL